MKDVTADSGTVNKAPQGTTTAERRPLSKRLRFEIFKRDGFRCLYCGATPQTTVLRVDHVEPVSKGGTDDPSNLVTSCFDCNAGKSAVRLEDKKHAPVMSAELAQDHAEQLRAYLEAQRDVLAAKQDLEAAFQEEWERQFDGQSMPESMRNGLKRALADFSLVELSDIISVVARHHKLGSHNHAGYERQVDRARYFFGALKKAREQRANPTPAVPEPTKDKSQQEQDDRRYAEAVVRWRAQGSIVNIYKLARMLALPDACIHFLMCCKTFAFEGVISLNVENAREVRRFADFVCADTSLTHTEQLKIVGSVINKLNELRVISLYDAGGPGKYYIVIPLDITGECAFDGDPDPATVCAGRVFPASEGFLSPLAAAGARDWGF